MRTLRRDDILKHRKLRSEVVEVPEWGGSVIVREMTGDERDQWEASALTDSGQVDPEAMRGARARLAALTIVDEEGGRLFSLEDAVALGAQSAAALDRVFSVGARLSGLTRKDLEELAKNLPGAPSAGSGSDSPSPSE